MRIAGFVGLFAFVVVTLCGMFAYRWLVDAKLVSFRERLESLAVSLAQTIDADEIERSHESAQSDGGRELDQLQAKLQRIVEDQADIESIYILRATDLPGELRFVLDASKQSRKAVRGERYDATRMPFMLDGFNRVSVEDRVYADEFGQTQSAYAPLLARDGHAVGIVGVDVLAVRLEQTKWQVVRFCVLIYGGACGAVLMLALVVRRRIHRPVADVLDAATAIASGQLDTKLHAPTRDEFGVLAERFGTMANALRDRELLRETFGLYVSRDLASTLMQNGRRPELGGMECVATVIFCDLANYTKISEALSPQQIISLINEYLAAMTALIEEHRGCLLDFTGDGIIAGFGVPLPNPEHAADAVRCAIAMRQRLTRLNGEWEARGLAARWQAIGIDRIEARMGIHTGPLVAGNIGGPTRMKYCVMGDTVNIAARLEQMNKDFNSTILVSDQVKIRVPASLTASFSDYGIVNIRGRVQAVGAFSV